MCSLKPNRQIQALALALSFQLQTSRDEQLREAADQVEREAAPLDVVPKAGWIGISQQIGRDDGKKDDEVCDDPQAKAGAARCHTYPPKSVSAPGCDFVRWVSVKNALANLPLTFLVQSFTVASYT